jgi:deoxyadenosine/deoxycytidine kinase
MNKGKIIAIIGAQRTGKSYLCEKLSKKLGYEFHLEGENGTFPEWLAEDIKNTTNTLRRVYWFRNKLVQSFLESKTKAESGNNILLDVVYTDVEAHASILLSGNDLEVVRETLEMDTNNLGYPDYIIYLKNDEENTKRYISLGGRSFDLHDEYFTDYVLPTQRRFEELIDKFPTTVRMLRLDRSKLDFDKEEDLEIVYNFINS